MPRQPGLSGPKSQEKFVIMPCKLLRKMNHAFIRQENVGKMDYQSIRFKLTKNPCYLYAT